MILDYIVNLAKNHESELKKFNKKKYKEILHDSLEDKYETLEKDINGLWIIRQKEKPCNKYMVKTIIEKDIRTDNNEYICLTLSLLANYTSELKVESITKLHQIFFDSKIKSYVMLFGVESGSKFILNLYIGTTLEAYVNKCITEKKKIPFNKLLLWIQCIVKGLKLLQSKALDLYAISGKNIIVAKDNAKICSLGFIPPFSITEQNGKITYIFIRLY